MKTIKMRITITITITITFCLLVFCLNIHAQSDSIPKAYVLLKEKRHARINSEALDSIDTQGKTDKAMLKSFNPKRGKNTYYYFEATFKGLSFDETTKTFHDILVLEVNEAGEIIKAYQYTKEWAEPPCQYDVFKSVNPKVKLKDGMNILDLKLVRTMLNWEEEPSFEPLDESGILLMNPD